MSNRCPMVSSKYRHEKANAVLTSTEARMAAPAVIMSIEKSIPMAIP